MGVNWYPGVKWSSTTIRSNRPKNQVESSEKNRVETSDGSKRLVILMPAANLCTVAVGLKVLLFI